MATTDTRKMRAVASGPLNHWEREEVNQIVSRSNTLWNRPIHCGAYFNDESETLVMNQNTWVRITNATNDIFTRIGNVGVTFAEDQVTIISPGHYMNIASLSFTGTTNADVYEFALFKNGTLQGPKIERTTTSTDIGNVSLPFYLACDEGDVLDLRVRNTANDFDATLVACSWVTWIIHYT